MTSTFTNPSPHALITGASSGIGAAYARRLAQDGYSLTLTARRQEKLEALARDLGETHGIRVETITADLALSDDVARLEQHLRETPPDLLINNAGFGTSGMFHEVVLEKHLAMLHVHVTATLRLCYAVLPEMLERRRGRIINVSSIAAFSHSKGNVVYCGTKAALNVMTEALAEELVGTGIKVQALCPGFTYSDFHDRPDLEGFSRDRIPKALWMTSEEVVEESLAGLETDKVIVVPGTRNRLIVAALTNPLTKPLLALRRRLRR